MYKVFFNDRKIIITEKADITISNIINTDEDLTAVDDVKCWFLAFVEDDGVDVNLISKNPEFFWKNVFVPAFKLINAAGGVVIRNCQILFIYRNEKWDLPKGKMDKGETKEEAALREVEEECGVKGHVITKQIPSTFHIYQSSYKKSKGKWILKETFWFEMDYQGDKDGTPQAEENITEIRWFKTNELHMVLRNTYENLKQIIEFYLD